MKNKKLAVYGLFIALAFVFGYIENLIPIPMPIPNMKLGIANIITIVVLYKLDIKSAVLVTSIRILLLSISFGNPYSMLYSFSGAAFSISIMTILKKFKFHILTVSMMGAVLHNIGQILVAVFVIETSELFYLIPVMSLIAGLSGILMGGLASAMIKRVKLVE